ncbi:hypothetical protein M406DRAFT_250828, partial [Cryphonectria parasitica EP155]
FRLKVQQNGICRACYKLDNKKDNKLLNFFSHENSLSFSMVFANLSEAMQVKKQLFARIHIFINCCLIWG